MQEDGLECFGVGSDVLGVHCGNDDHYVALFLRIATIASHDAENIHAARFGFVNDRDEVWTDIALAISTANGEDKQHVSRSRVGNLQPVGKRAVPSIVVDPGGKFGDVIHGGGSIYTGQFAKVVYGMTAISRTASNAAEKQAAAFGSKAHQPSDNTVDRIDVDLLRNLNGFPEIPGQPGSTHKIRLSRERV